MLIIEKQGIKMIGKQQWRFKKEKIKGITVENLKYADLPFNPFSEINKHQKSVKMSLKAYLKKNWGVGNYRVYVFGGNMRPYMELFKGDVK